MATYTKCVFALKESSNSSFLKGLTIIKFLENFFQKYHFIIVITFHVTVIFSSNLFSYTFATIILSNYTKANHFTSLAKMLKSIFLIYNWIMQIAATLAYAKPHPETHIKQQHYWSFKILLLSNYIIRLEWKKFKLSIAYRNNHKLTISASRMLRSEFHIEKQHIRRCFFSFLLLL